MRSKTQKKFILISSVAIMILLAMMTFILLDTSAPVAQAAAGDMYVAEYVGDNGSLPGDAHLTKEEIAAKYNKSTLSVLTINSGQMLYDYLNGNYSGYSVGYLESDVGISYNSVKEGYYNTNVNSSNAIFDRIFDGNGYTLNLYGGVGDANSNVEISDNDARRKSRRNNLDGYGPIEVWYEYTGFLVAENYGTIANLKIDYTSPHTGIVAEKGEWNGDGPLGIAKSNRILSKRDGSFCAGIVAGLNGYGGVIDNVKLTLNNAFTAIKMYYNGDGKGNGYYTENTAYAGGIAGRIEENSTISGCWVDITDSAAGIYSGAQGKSASSVTGNTDNHNALAMAGGIVGNIDSGTAKLEYCAISGTGQIRAFANRATKGYRAYAGGIAAGCVQIKDYSTVTDCNSGTAVQAGQIKGAISAWTGSRFTNFDNVPRTSMGLLFDAVGTDENVESLAILFNLEDLMDANPDTYKPTSSDGKVVCDSSGNLRNWMSIHPTSDGGRMTVQFDRENPKYDIRVHAIADGHENMDETLDNFDMTSLGVPFYQYKLPVGSGGGFIWSAKFETSSDSSNHIKLDLDDPIYAEIYMLNSGRTGKYNFEFGKMGVLEYEDTNSTDRNKFKQYDGSALKLPKVRMTNDAAFDTSVFNSQDLWNITYTNVSGSNTAQVDVAQTYMPGTYTMKVETTIGERTYGYYNEAQRRLAWQPKDNYLFTILQGKLSFGDNTTSTDGWQSAVTFELKMNAASDFDTLEFQRNGVFPEDSTQGFEYDGATATYTVTAGTGKNGTNYTFFAYKRDPITGENVLVASSESRTVKIDTEAPEVSEPEYYMVEDGKERLLSEDELEEIQRSWTKNQILVKYSVSDNGKSGVASAATESYIENEELPNGDYNVVVSVNDSLPKTLLYIDARGNTTSLDIQFNVDRVQGRLEFAGSSYRPSSGLSYSRENVTIRYKATFGLSGWRMYYSYQKDADGNDIWVARGDQDQMVNSGANKTFVIDWNMGDVRLGKTAQFKIKMVNLAGLYEDEVFPIDSTGHRFPDDVIGEYIIWRRIADIYIDAKLDNIFLDNAEGEDISVEQILQSGEAAKYFDKEYDGTSEYEGKKQYKFYMDVSALGPNFLYNDKIGVLYSTAFFMSRPAIDLGVKDGKLPVLLEYKNSDAGNVGIRISVPLSGNNYYNYAIYFTNLDNIDFEYDFEAEYGTYWDHVDIDANISKRIVEINLADQDELKANFVYGDEIPNELQINVPQTNAIITVALKTDASSTANIGEYPILGTAPKFDNVEYVVNSMNITIGKRPVAVDLRYDDGEIGNIPTGEQAGTTHYITGTYDDVNGDSQPVNVKYYLDGKEVDALAKVGEYRFDLSLTDSNYTIDGQISFRFVIQKGYLNVTTGVRVVDFTEEQILYNPIIPQEADGLYDKEDITITYYKYYDGATYDSVTGEITGTYNRQPLAEPPIERGIYYVEVSYARETENFYPKTYSAGSLIITKAATTINVETTNLEYSFDNYKLYSFDLKDAITEVRSSSDNLLWNSADEAEGYIKIYYYKDGTYTQVPKDETSEEGWYSRVGTYRYKLEYVGNDDYDKSELIVNMTITNARFKNINFTRTEYEFNYDGKVYLPEVRGLGAYPGIQVRYQYGTRTVNSLDEFKFVNAGRYEIKMYADLEDFEPFECKTVLIINKAQFKNITVENINVDYDGQKHTVKINGLRGSVEDGLYYDDGITAGGVNVIIKSGNEEGVLFATDVKIDPATGLPTNHGGTIVLSANNYENLSLNTYININQIEFKYTEIGKTVPYKVPSGMSLSDYKGYYELNGEKFECDLIYFDKEGNVVVPNEDGVLADGSYTVKIKLPNSNYYINEYWRLEIGEINSKSLTTLGIIAVVAVAMILIAAVVTAVVVVKKRKQAGIV